MADQKAVVVVTVTKGDNKYEFHMPMNSPLGECYDACFEIMNEVVVMSQAAAKRAERAVEEKDIEAKEDDEVVSS